MNDSKITQALLRELFEYREDGVFVRKVATSNRVKVGDVVGWKTVGDRYVGLCVNGKKEYMHRMMFLYHHGYLPKYIDHVDGDGSNNRIENLREATQSENLYNLGCKSNNKCGIKNISWDKNQKKWIVTSKVFGKKTYFGSYNDLELAELVAIEVREKYHGKFANHTK
jgi:hypothetical protein